MFRWVLLPETPASRAYSYTVAVISSISRLLGENASCICSDQEAAAFQEQPVLCSRGDIPWNRVRFRMYGLTVWLVH